VRGDARAPQAWQSPQITETLDTFPAHHKRIDETRSRSTRRRHRRRRAGAIRELTVPWGSEQKAIGGLFYYQALALPNFYFHLTTAYDILRHNGVPLTKTDFTGTF
jgi:hypothetical protein